MPNDDGNGATHHRDAQVTRNRLLQAARRRFAVFGYDRTTTRDIAADAGVNISLIKRYFGSKQGLFVEVLNESSRLFTRAAGPPGETDRPADPRDLVDMLMASLHTNAWPDFGDEHPIMLMVRHAATDPATVRLRRQSMLTGIAEVERALPAGAGTAQHRRLRAEMIVALYIGMVVLRGLLPDEPLAAAGPDELRAALLRFVSA